MSTEATEDTKGSRMEGQRTEPLETLRGLCASVFNTASVTLSEAKGAYPG